MRYKRCWRRLGSARRGIVTHAARWTLCGWLCLPLMSGAAQSELASSGAYRICDAGQPRDFIVAADELFQEGASPSLLRLPSALSFSHLCEVAENRKAKNGTAARLVLYERGVPRNDQSRRILTPKVLVQFKEGADAQQIGDASGAAAWRAVKGMPSWWFFEAQKTTTTLTLAEKLRGQPGVLYAEPQLSRLPQPKFLPNDPLFPRQWHLLNLGQTGGVPGLDIGVVDVWDSWRGNDVVVGIVDDGVQSDHPDLLRNLSATRSVNLNSNRFNFALDSHGTPVAGIVAATANNDLGSAGVAFESSLADIRLLGDWTTDEQDRAAMLHQNDTIQIKNNSWGASDGYGVLEGPGPLMASGMNEGTSQGREGRGEIYVFAGGNGGAAGDDVNYDGFANAIQVIAVGAVGNDGLLSSYSEPGACLALVAPSRGGTSCGVRPGITTTDLTGSYGHNPGPNCETPSVDYTSDFGGTSAAAPTVSGVVALLLQACPTLGWRDVKEILLRSSIKLNPADPEWHTNMAEIAHHHRLGAGLVNARAAIALGTGWANLDPALHLSFPQTNLNLQVPDNDPAGMTLHFTVTNAGFRVEHAVLTVALPHARHGDLAITLTSPRHTASRLAEAHTSSGAGYNSWKLTSLRHWGESADGTWTVRIADLRPGGTGSLSWLQLSLHGTKPTATLSANQIGDQFTWRLRAAAPGWHYTLQSSSDLNNWVDEAHGIVQVNGLASFPAHTPSQTLQFFRARLSN